MACRLCLDYLATTTCVVSSRPACTESAEEPILVQRDTDLYLAQVADLREFAQATEAGEGTMHLEDALRQRESGGPTSTGSLSWPPSPRPLFR
jgi:hypothetical protein